MSGTGVEADGLVMADNKETGDGMWEAIAKFIEATLGHGRLPLAVLATCAWVLYRNANGSPYNFDQPIAYFEAGFVFSAIIVCLQIFDKAKSRYNRWCDDDAAAKTNALKLEADKRKRAELLDDLASLPSDQLAWLQIMKMREERKFHGRTDLHILIALRRQGYIEVEGDAMPHEYKYRVPQDVWDAIPLEGFDEQIIADVREEDPPWKTRNNRV